MFHIIENDLDYNDEAGIVSWSSNAAVEMAVVGCWLLCLNVKIGCEWNDDYDEHNNNSTNNTNGSKETNTTTLNTASKQKYSKTKKPLKQKIRNNNS